jgi:hypothetical protein
MREQYTDPSEWMIEEEARQEELAAISRIELELEQEAANDSL